jgi:hypothetical protein
MRRITKYRRSRIVDYAKAKDLLIKAANKFNELTDLLEEASNYTDEPYDKEIQEVRDNLGPNYIWDLIDRI